MAPKAKEQAEQTAIDVSDVDANAPESVELANCINRANALLEQKVTVLSGLQECRELATLLTRTGSGSREQVAWVREYLPRKSRNKDGNGAE